VLVELQLLQRAKKLADGHTKPEKPISCHPPWPNYPLQPCTSLETNPLNK